MPKKPPRGLTTTDSSPSYKSLALKRTQVSLDAIDSISKRVDEILEWLTPVPTDWLTGGKSSKGEDSEEAILPIECESYDTLVGTWRKAIRWRTDLDDILVSMLSICISAMQQGDQLFLMVVGNASGGKTTFCDGLLISKHCYPVEYLSGFFSGFKGEGGEDYSLAARIHGRTMITPEGDTMVSHPRFMEHMSQARRLFDGAITTSYKNQKEDTNYAGLRTPWILVGTPTLLELDQSRLGDRFLKIFVGDPSEEQRQTILKRSSHSALEAVQTGSEGKKLVSVKMMNAQRMTGGYVDYLRDNATRLLSSVVVEEIDLDLCERLGEFTAFMRARPGKSEESPTAKEEPFRLAKQYVRLMVSMAATMGLEEVDDRTARLVRKIAQNTSTGPLLEIVQVLFDAESDYLMSKTIAIYVDRQPDSVQKYLKFMRKIGVVQLMSDRKDVKNRTSKPMWCLTDKVKDLYTVAFDLE